MHQNQRKKIPYFALGLCVALVVLTITIWLPNLQLIGLVLSSDVSFIEKISFLFGLYPSLATNFTLVSGTFAILIASLFGINVALLAYYIQEVHKKTSTMTEAHITGIGGLISGIIGVGCASCGTLFLGTLLAFFGAAGVITLLPYNGEEFGAIGVLLLLYTSYSLRKKIITPLVCAS